MDKPRSGNKNEKALAFSILILVAFSCKVPKQTEPVATEKEKFQSKIDRIKTIVAENKLDMKNQIATFLIFQENNTEEAMNFYVKVFEDSEIVEI